MSDYLLITFPLENQATTRSLATPLLPAESQRPTDT
jgi:hypothetical protein